MQCSQKYMYSISTVIHPLRNRMQRTHPSPHHTHTPSPSHTHKNLQFVALLAFALTAGFHSAGDSNSVTCTSNQTGLPNYTASVDFAYPYTGNTYSARVLTPDNFTNNNTQCHTSGDTLSVYVTLYLINNRIQQASYTCPTCT